MLQDLSTEEIDDLCFIIFGTYLKRKYDMFGYKESILNTNYTFNNDILKALFDIFKHKKNEGVGEIFYSTLSKYELFYLSFLKSNYNMFYVKFFYFYRAITSIYSFIHKGKSFTPKERYLFLYENFKFEKYNPMYNFFNEDVLLNEEKIIDINVILKVFFNGLKIFKLEKNNDKIYQFLLSELKKTKKEHTSYISKVTFIQTFIIINHLQMVSNLNLEKTEEEMITEFIINTEFIFSDYVDLNGVYSILPLFDVYKIDDIQTLEFIEFYIYNETDYDIENARLFLLNGLSAMEAICNSTKNKKNVKNSENFRFSGGSINNYNDSYEEKLFNVLKFLHRNKYNPVETFIIYTNLINFEHNIAKQLNIIISDKNFKTGFENFKDTDFYTSTNFTGEVSYLLDKCKDVINKKYWFYSDKFGDDINGFLNRKNEFLNVLDVYNMLKTIPIIMESIQSKDTLQENNISEPAKRIVSNGPIAIVKNTLDRDVVYQSYHDIFVKYKDFFWLKLTPRKIKEYKHIIIKNLEDYFNKLKSENKSFVKYLTSINTDFILEEIYELGKTFQGIGPPDVFTLEDWETIQTNRSKIIKPSQENKEVHVNINDNIRNPILQDIWKPDSRATLHYGNYMPLETPKRLIIKRSETKQKTLFSDSEKTVYTSLVYMIPVCRHIYDNDNTKITFDTIDDLFMKNKYEVDGFKSKGDFLSRVQRRLGDLYEETSLTTNNTLKILNASKYKNIHYIMSCLFEHTDTFSCDNDENLFITYFNMLKCFKYGGDSDINGQLKTYGLFKILCGCYKESKNILKWIPSILGFFDDEVCSMDNQKEFQLFKTKIKTYATNLEGCFDKYMNSINELNDMFDSCEYIIAREFFIQKYTKNLLNILDEVKCYAYLLIITQHFSKNSGNVIFFLLKNRSN